MAIGLWDIGGVTKNPLHINSGPEELHCQERGRFKKKKNPPKAGEL